MPNEEFIAFGPVAPYSFPLPVPPVDPDATLTQCVEFNMAFLPYILGGLAPLLLPEAWDTDDVNEKLLAIARIDHLRYLLMNPELCTSSSLCLTLAQIMQDAEGNLALFVAGLLAKTLESCGEFIKEQLESIISLDAIMGFFFGTSADMAEFASVLPEYGVEVTLPQYRLNGCGFEVSFDGGTTWIPQFEFSLEACAALAGPQGPQGNTGATGPQGPQGAQGVKGDTGAAGPSSGATVQPVDVGTGPNICAGSKGIKDWAAQLLEAGLSKIDQSAAAFAVAGTIMGETIIGDFILNDLLNQVAAFEALTTTTIRADDTPTAELDVDCAFYCALKDITTQVTAEDIIAVALSLSGSSNNWIKSLAGLMLASGGQEFLAAYNAAATNEDNSCAASCTSCPEGWCFKIDFTADSGGFSPVVAQGQNIAVYSAGNGWQAVYNRNGQHVTEVRITRTLAASAHFTEYDIEWSFASNLSDAFTLGFNVNIGAQTGGSHVHSTGTCDVTTTDLRTDMADVNDAGGALITIHAITFRGTGANPFGTDNCV